MHFSRIYTWTEGMDEACDMWLPVDDNDDAAMLQFILAEEVASDDIHVHPDVFAEELFTKEEMQNADVIVAITTWLELMEEFPVRDQIKITILVFEALGVRTG